MSASERNARFRERHPNNSAVYSRRWREKNPEKVRAANLARTLEEKRRAFAIIGSRCVRCGCDDVRPLETNHVDGGGSAEARERIARGVGGPTWHAVLRGERTTDGLNTLCRLCNALEYVERRFPDLKGAWRIEWLVRPSVVG